MLSKLNLNKKSSADRIIWTISGVTQVNREHNLDNEILMENQMRDSALSGIFLINDPREKSQNA